MTAVDAVRSLESTIARYGSPKALVCDNGSEFRADGFVKWACRRGIEVQCIEPGKPMQNAFAESFNARFRDECLNVHWFESLAGARRR